MEMAPPMTSTLLFKFSLGDCFVKIRIGIKESPEKANLQKVRTDAEV
jgi:hypothetical protein